MSESMLEVAKRTHKTDFGSWEDVSARFEDNKIETPVGTFICYYDGTFCDTTNRLMWIQAPWGMTFNGKKFKGEAIKLNWNDATQLFGYAGRIPHPQTSGLRKKHVKEWAHQEFKRGSCIVEFSGYKDWRLPTAEEILSLCLYDHNEEYHHESIYDGYHYNGDVKSIKCGKHSFLLSHPLTLPFGVQMT